MRAWKVVSKNLEAVPSRLYRKSNSFTVYKNKEIFKYKLDKNCIQKIDY